MTFLYDQKLIGLFRSLASVQVRSLEHTEWTGPLTALVCMYVCLSEHLKYDHRARLQIILYLCENVQKKKYLSDTRIIKNVTYTVYLRPKNSQKKNQKI